MKKTVILIGIGLLAVIASILGTLFATGNLPGGQSEPVATEAEAVADAAPPKPDPSDLIYVALDPAFVVSFHDSATAQFLQFDLEVAVEDKAIEEVVNSHKPAIRNALVMILSNQDPERLLSREGKEALRVKILEEIRTTMTGLTGEPGVADAYFTSFLMQ